MNSAHKKVLILSYYFPPGNFAGSYRIASWAEYLHESGYYPIVVTRHWNEGQTDFTGISDKREVEVEKNNQYEIHRLPYRGNLRDRMKRYGSKTVFIRKALSFMELLLQHFTNRAIPFHNLYDYALDLLKAHPDLRLLIVSGRPHVSYRFGYLLHKKTGIRWIADYRDPWNTHKLLTQRVFILIRLLEQASEKKWVASAAAVTTCSEKWRDDIQHFTGVKGYLVMNGYDEGQNYMHQPNREHFTLLHNGSLYEMQDVSVFINGLKRFIDEVSPSLRIYFPGIAIDPAQVERIQREIKGYEKYFELHERLPKQRLVELLNRAHLLLLFGSHEAKGWYPIKVFEYLAAKKNIMLCPSDHDALEQIIKETNAGVCLNHENEVFNYLREKYHEWKNAGELRYRGDEAVISRYSRRAQAKKLAEALDAVAKDNAPGTSKR